MSPRGLFVAFEGGEGSGKSTQAALLATRIDAVATHEPGGTAFGARARSLVLDPGLGDLDARAEALVMAADRAQHVAAVVRPALEAGRDVVSDRFAWSSIAYQGYGRGLPVGEVEALSDWATGGLWPELTILMDLPPGDGAARLTSLDRIEAEDSAFHERVTHGYRELARSRSGWVVLDATKSREELAEEVLAAVEAARANRA